MGQTNGWKEIAELLCIEKDDSKETKKEKRRSGFVGLKSLLSHAIKNGLEEISIELPKEEYRVKRKMEEDIKPEEESEGGYERNIVSRLSILEVSNIATVIEELIGVHRMDLIGGYTPENRLSTCFRTFEKPFYIEYGGKKYTIAVNLQTDRIYDRKVICLEIRKGATGMVYIDK